MNGLRIEPVPGSNPYQYRLMIDHVEICVGSQGEIEERANVIRKQLRRTPLSHDESEISQMLELIETQFAQFLTPWEVEFVESIEGQYAKKRSLTDGQLIKLNEIWDRVTKNG